MTKLQTSRLLFMAHGANPAPTTRRTLDDLIGRRRTSRDVSRIRHGLAVASCGRPLTIAADVAAAVETRPHAGFANRRPVKCIFTTATRAPGRCVPSTRADVTLRDRILAAHGRASSQITTRNSSLAGRVIDPHRVARPVAR